MPIGKSERRFVSFRGIAPNVGVGPSSAGKANAATVSVSKIVPASSLVKTGTANNASVTTQTTPGGVATSRVGFTWTQNRPASSMDSVLSVHDMQMQHMIEFGAGNPWPTQASMSAPQFAAQLDPMMQDVRDAGAVQRVLCFHKAPGWMKASGNTSDDNRPLDAQFGNFATISAQAAARYTDFQWGMVWNEYKGFWNNALNRPDWETFLTFYTQVRNAVKAVRPTMKVGGPYTTMISCSYERQETTQTAAFPGGFFDGRWLSALQHFIQNATYDFLSFDMGIDNFAALFGGVVMGAPPDQQIQKFRNLIQWIRSFGGTAATCPIICAETYIQASMDPPYSYTAAQTEDLFITMCAQTQAVSPNGPIYWLPWGAPNFWPQVVNRVNTTTWANTESTFRAKVANWHATGGGVGPGTSPSDLFTLFQTRYPASGSEIWVDGSLGNDANAGTSGAPKQTIQAAINVSVAGSKIMVRPGNYATHEFAGHAGTAGNYIQMIAPNGGAKILANGGSGPCSSATSIHGSSAHHIAIYGFEYQGLNSVSTPYESGVTVSNGAHNVAVWKCFFHDLASHGVCLPGASGQGFAGSDKIDACYNRITRCARWNEFQASGISTISMANLDSAWADGYKNHFVGNVIDACWTDGSRLPPFGSSLTDGNALILDHSSGYTGLTGIWHNLTVGCGGRGLHALGHSNVDIWLNTSMDNVQNLTGTWDCELSLDQSTGSEVKFNVAGCRVGRNRVGLLAATSTSSVWSDNVFVRGTGGSEANDPSVSSSNNINKTVVGPSGYFQQYQQGQFAATSISNIAGFRPLASQISTFTPAQAIRDAVGAWPDALGFLRPSSGVWAYGAFEANT